MRKKNRGVMKVFGRDLNIIGTIDESDLIYPEAKELLEVDWALSDSHYLTNVLDFSDNALKGALEYLERNNLQQHRQLVLRKELEYRENPNPGIGGQEKNFRTYTGRLFSEEWEDVRRAAYLIRHPKKKPRTVIRFYYPPRKRVG